MYRTNTYPLIHLGFIHALLNAIALLPLLERFEAEHGTLLTGAMFAGRMCSLVFHLAFVKFKLTNLYCILALSTLPAAAYLLIERGALRGNATVSGAR